MKTSSIAHGATILAGAVSVPVTRARVVVRSRRPLRDCPAPELDFPAYPTAVRVGQVAVDLRPEAGGDADERYMALDDHGLLEFGRRVAEVREQAMLAELASCNMFPGGPRD